MPRRHSPGRQLAHQGTDISDLVQQIVMPARVEPVHASGQHRDLVTTSSQRSTMHCTLDPKSTRPVDPIVFNSSGESEE